MSCQMLDLLALYVATFLCGAYGEFRTLPYPTLVLRFNKLDLDLYG